MNYSNLSALQRYTLLRGAICEIIEENRASGEESDQDYLEILANVDKIIEKLKKQ